MITKPSPDHSSIKFPLSRNQERMWLLEKLAVNKAVYHNPSVIRIDGPLKLNPFKQACSLVIQKHEQLRVTIKEIENQPFQFINAASPIAFSFLCLESAPEVIESTIQEIIQTPFDFQEGPLCQFTLIQVKEEAFIFIMNLHHLISDGWSKSILLKNLLELYFKCSSNQAPIQFTQQHSYQDFVDYQLSNRETSSWKDLYSTKIEPLQLVSSYLPFEKETGKGSLFPFRFDKHLSDKVLEFTKEHEITPFLFLLSVFSVFLFRISGQNNFAIGSPVSGRLKKEWEEIVGFFVNTVAIPIYIEGTPTYLDYLSKLKELVFKILANQSLPFEEVVKHVNPIREAHRNPIFQVMFQYDNFPLPSLEIEHLTLTPQTVDFGIAQMDLSLTFWRDQGGLCGTLEYKTDLFDKATVERFYSYLISITQSILDNPLEQITNLNLISDQEEELVDRVNATACELPYLNYVSQLQDAVSLYPNQTAIISNEETISFRELEDRSNQLARSLQKRGIKYQSRVALLLPASIATIVAMIAVSKLGAMFSIIDPHSPINRQQALLNLFQPDLTLSNLKEGLESFHLVKIDELLDQSKNEDSRSLDLIISEHGALCTIFTSGTTNHPRGVVLSHLSLANLIHSFIQSYQVATHDKILALSSVASASFLGEVLPSLCSGATLMLVDYQTMLDGKKLTSFIEQHQVTIMSTVPSFIRQLNAQRIQPSSLRYLLSGGEALFAKHISHLKSPLKIINGYGLTEATICSSYEMINPENPSQQEDFTLGRPICNSELHILDEHGNIAPIGCTGEIGISGLGLMRGYLHDSVLTEQAFTFHPRDKKKKILLTKDIGIRLADGNIRYIGRKDYQVKIRGFRVNLLEIEKSILESGLVKNAAVKAIEGPNGNQLYAVVEATPEPSLIETIKAWLNERLPHYMVPAEIQAIEEIPYNQNGKVDWKQIHSFSLAKQKPKFTPQLTNSRIEKELICIWQEALDKDEVDINQNFFDLGGHSILLMDVQHAIKQKLNLEVEMILLFKFPTIRLLAEYLQSTDKSMKIEASTLQSRAAMQRMAAQESRKRIAIFRQ